MEQILSVWSKLDIKRRAIVVAATLAMFAAVIGVSRMAARPTMALLYAGLEPGPAGEVVQALEAQGVAFEIRGPSILVDAARRDELRMVLASDGIPANSAKGYELLDGLSGFGTTSQMFDAAYWRAKEGELARTIMSAPAIRTARVHLGNPTGGSFGRQQRPTASVTVGTADGTLSPSHAKALKYLVASAVAGLAPEDVSVIDSRGGIVLTGDDALARPGGADDRAADLKRNIERLLEARVGYGNAVVEVTVETVTETEQIVERRFDPEGRVAISSETEERTNSASDSRGAGVTIASNLPEGDAGSNGASSTQDSETRERINYEVSETKRELHRAPGAIRRQSVAVLLDGIRSLDPETGTEVWTARSEAEIGALRDLVVSAAGIDEARGDTLTIKSMEFEPIAASGTSGEASLFQSLNLDVMTLIQLAVLALVSLVLGLFVIRPILARPPLVPAPPPLPKPVPDTPPAWPALDGEIQNDEFTPPAMAVVSDFDLGEGFDDDNDPVKRLKKMIEDRQAETVEILRGWMDAGEEGA